ncbi:MAG: cell division protein FtsQ/DivIB [Gammaproteobacteria bacterium]|jgi:cell division protein FtsQ
MEDQTASKRKLYIWLLLLIVIVGIVVWAGFKLYSPNTLPIRSVVVNGDLRFINQQELKQTLQPLSKQGFFSVDLADVQCKVHQLPWVAEVEIKRVWPDKIVVNIETCKPVAQWNKDSYLNAYGEVFTPQSSDNLPKNLPHFFGKQDQTVKILDNYQQMNNILAQLQLHIQSLACDDDENWQIMLNNGIKLQLGRKNILNRLANFTRIYQKLLVAHNNIIPKTIDLRYSHGLAVSYDTINGVRS